MASIVYVVNRIRAEQPLQPGEDVVGWQKRTWVQAIKEAEEEKHQLYADRKASRQNYGRESKRFLPLEEVK